MKYESKQALLDDIHRRHDLLCAQLDAIPAGRCRERGVWGDGWTIVDLIAHLAEWQSMFLRWYEDGQSGVRPQMPAPGYKWNELSRLNRAIWAKHHSRRLSSIRAEFDSGYARIVEIAERLSAPQLLDRGRFKWTGNSSLALYLGANTASHYGFAMKVIKRWLKGASVGPALTRRRQRR